MNRCFGEQLVALGAAIAIQIANNVSVDDANILGALFTVIGDQLALIAATEVSSSNSSNNGNSNNNNNNSDSGNSSNNNNKTSKDNNTNDSKTDNDKKSNKDTKSEEEKIRIMTVY